MLKNELELIQGNGFDTFYKKLYKCYFLMLHVTLFTNATLFKYGISLKVKTELNKLGLGLSIECNKSNFKFIEWVKRNGDNL